MTTTHVHGAFLTEMNSSAPEEYIELYTFPARWFTEEGLITHFVTALTTRLAAEGASAEEIAAMIEEMREYIEEDAALTIYYLNILSGPFSLSEDGSTLTLIFDYGTEWEEELEFTKR